MKKNYALSFAGILAFTIQGLLVSTSPANSNACSAKVRLNAIFLSFDVSRSDVNGK
ncbi:MAG: hypothetical protein ABI432_00835 [Flavobacteriales bacterium]